LHCDHFLWRGDNGGSKGAKPTGKFALWLATKRNLPAIPGRYLEPFVTTF
jgi:hypothetical protein